jgi:phage baseplate assembly protein W
MRDKGYFRSADRYDLAWSDLLIALLTPIGSQPMNRSFGSGLSRLLFSPADTDCVQVVRMTVEDTVSKWVPHVRIRAVAVAVDRRSIQLRVSFGLTGEQGSVDRAALIDKSAELLYLTRVP